MKNGTLDGIGTTIGIHLPNPQMEQILDRLTEHVIYQDTSMKILWANRAACDSVGKVREELIGKCCYEIWPNRDTPCIECPVAKAIISGESHQENVTTPDGRTWFIKGEPLKDDRGTVVGGLEITFETTDHVPKEKSFEESEEKYQILFTNANEGVLIMDMRGKVQEVNKRLSSMTGFPPEDFLGKSSLDLAKMLHVSTKQVMSKFTGFIRGETRGSEWTITASDGRKVDISVYPTTIKKSTKSVGIFAMITDITERKRAETALRESEEKYRSLTDNINVGIYRNTPGAEGRFIEANPAFIRMFGFESKDELLNLKVSDLYYDPKDRHRFNQKMIKNKSVRNEELLLKRKDGKRFWGSITANVTLNQKGQVAYYDGLIEDITEWKESESAREQAEAALKESEQKYRRIFENFQDLYYRTDAEGFIIEVSPSLTPLSGFRSDEVVGKSVYDFYLHRRDRVQFTKELRDKGRIIDYELTLIGKGDRRIPVSISSQVLYDESGTFIGIEGVVRDITERKQAEDAIRESEERYRNVYNTAPLAFVVWDRECRVTDWNEHAEKLFGWSKAEVLNKNFFNFLIPEKEKPQVKDIVDSLLKGNLGRHNINDNVTKSGDTIVCEWNNSILYNQQGEVIGAISLGLDITNRKKSEDKIQASLREKELLLKEIHHRVKNNMQVISSLLSLQSQHVQDENALLLFKESQYRVRSMALVHEKLYQSDNFAEVNFSDYIQDLALKLFRSYEMNPEEIELDINMQNVALGIDLAVPCGLVVNELISNALKHAFSHSGNETGKISIDLREKGDMIVLSVSDDGTGIPPDLNFRQTDSLGLKLIVLLAEDQMEGTVSLDRSNGTKFTIVFPKSKS